MTKAERAEYEQVYAAVHLAVGGPACGLGTSADSSSALATVDSDGQEIPPA